MTRKSLYAYHVHYLRWCQCYWNGSHSAALSKKKQPLGQLKNHGTQPKTTDVLDKTIQTYSNVAIFLLPNFFRTALCWPLSDGFCFLVSMDFSPILTHSLVGWEPKKPPGLAPAVLSPDWPFFFLIYIYLCVYICISYIYMGYFSGLALSFSNRKNSWFGAFA